jgi:hypothetical protein
MSLSKFQSRAAELLGRSGVTLKLFIGRVLAMIRSVWQEPVDGSRFLAGFKVGSPLPYSQFLTFILKCASVSSINMLIIYLSRRYLPPVLAGPITAAVAYGVATWLINYLKAVVPKFLEPTQAQQQTPQPTKVNRRLAVATLRAPPTNNGVTLRAATAAAHGEATHLVVDPFPSRYDRPLVERVVSHVPQVLLMSLKLYVAYKVGQVLFRAAHPTIRDIYSSVVDWLKQPPRYHPDTMRAQFTAIPLTQSRVIANHTHGDAAADRGSAVSTMVRIAALSGSQAYFVQKSKTDERRGRLGSRSYYWTKDLEVGPAIVDLPLNPVIILVDVDQYLDMPKMLSETNIPYLIYTFQPNRVARVRSNYAYTFNANDEVEFRVTGGAMYQHHVWNYSHDHLLAVTTLFGIPYQASAYLVDRRSTDADHEIICLTPQGHWGLLSAWVTYFLYGQRLQRLRVAFGEFLRLQVFETAGMFTSTGRVGAYHSSYITASSDDAIASIARASKYDLTSPQAAAFVDGDREAAAALVEYHRHKAGHKPDVVYPVSQGVVRYQSNPAAYDPDAKAGMVAFMGPLMHGAFVPDRTLANEQWSIDARVVKVQPPLLTATPLVARVMQEFVEQLIPVPGQLHPTDFEEVMERQARPTQRAILSRSEYINPIRMISSFMKREAYQDVKPPRAISQINGADKRDYSLYIYAFERVVKNQPWYAFSRTPKDIAARVVEVLSRAQWAVNSDFSKFDGHGSNLMRELEKLALMRAFDPRYHQQLLELFEAQFNLNAVGAFGTQYETKFTRASGSPETSILNSLVNAFVAYLALRMSKRRGQFIDPKAAYQGLGIYGGDDGLTADVDPVVYKRAATSIGQDLTAEPIRRGFLGIKFLARMYSPDVWFGDDNSVCDLPRQLSKFHVTVALPPDVTPAQKLMEKARAYVLSDENTPILGPYVKKAIQLGSYVPAHAAAVQVRPWIAQFDKENQYPNEGANWMYDYAAHALPEFDVKRFTTWLADCKEVGDLLEPVCCTPPIDPKVKDPVVVDHEVLPYGTRVEKRIPTQSVGQRPLPAPPAPPAFPAGQPGPAPGPRPQPQGPLAPPVAPRAPARSAMARPRPFAAPHRQKETFEQLKARKQRDGTWVENNPRERPVRQVHFDDASRPRKGSAIGAVTPEREMKQAAVDSIDALIGAERFS